MASSIFAVEGIYASSQFLSWLPGLWLPMAPVFLCVTPWLLSARLRHATALLASTTPAVWFTHLQILRVAALGSLIKGAMGVLPLHVTRRQATGTLPTKVLVIWNLLGAAIIALPGPVLIQAGLPGAIRWFDAPPTAGALLEFPMVLAPGLVVPLFVIVNGLMAGHTWVQSRRP